MEGYWTIKKAFPGSNAVELLVRKSDGLPVIWKPASGHKGRGSVYWGWVSYRVNRLLGFGVLSEATIIGIPQPGLMIQFLDGADIHAICRTEEERRKILSGNEDYRKLRTLDWVLGNADRYDWHIYVLGNAVKWQGRAIIRGIDNTNIFHYGASISKPEDAVRAMIRLEELEDAMVEIRRYAESQYTEELERRIREVAEVR